MTASRQLGPAAGRRRRVESAPTPREVKYLAVASGAACPEAIDSQSLICLASLIWAVTPAQACVAVSSFQDPLGGFSCQAPPTARRPGNQTRKRVDARSCPLRSGTFLQQRHLSKPRRWRAAVSPWPRLRKHNGHLALACALNAKAPAASWCPNRKVTSAPRISEIQRA